MIEEIEEMMQDSPDMEPEHNPSQSDLSMISLDVQRATSSPSYEKSESPLIKSDTNKQFYILIRSPVIYILSVQTDHNMQFFLIDYLYVLAIVFL